MPLSTIASVSFRDDRHGIVLGSDTTAGSAATRDGGRTWTRGGPQPLASGIYGGVFVPGARVPTVVAVGPAGLAWSRDDGMSWTVINRNVYWSVGFTSRPASAGRSGAGAA